MAIFVSRFVATVLSFLVLLTADAGAHANVYSAVASPSTYRGMRANAAETPTPTPTDTGTSTATPTATGTSSATSSASASATATRTSSATASATATATMTATATATATMTATATATGSMTATGTLTPTPTISTTSTASASPTPFKGQVDAGIAAGWFGGMLFAGVFVAGAALFFPAFAFTSIRTLHSRFGRPGGLDGNSAGNPRTPLLDHPLLDETAANSGQQHALATGRRVASPPSSSSAFGASSATSSSSSSASSSSAAVIADLQTQLDTYKAMVFASSTGGGVGAAGGTGGRPGASAVASAAAGGAASGAGAGVWDQREFLRRCSEVVSKTAIALDECVCDAFTAAPAGAGGDVNTRMAKAMRMLWSGASAAVEGHVSSQKQALLQVSTSVSTATGIGGAAMSSSTSPSSAMRQNLESSTLFTVYNRSVLELMFCDSAVWSAMATQVLQSWCNALITNNLCTADGAQGIMAGAASCGLLSAIQIHLQLAMWPAITGSSLRWALSQPASALTLERCAHDIATQQSFSLDGRPVQPGSQVFIVGPSLFSSSSTATTSALAVSPEVSAMRQTCKTLVIPAV